MVICSGVKTSLIIYKYLHLFIYSTVYLFFVMPVRISHTGLTFLSNSHGLCNTEAATAKKTFFGM